MKNDLCHLTLEKPPVILFYAVPIEDSDKVYKRGLNRLKNPFIEMYETRQEARGTIRNKIPSLFAILSGAMAEDGYKFFYAETGEWLTDEVPSKYLLLQ